MYEFRNVDTNMESFIDPNLSEDLLKKLVINAKEYAISNGIVMGSRNYEEDMVTFSPFCLFPSSFSKLWFDYAKDIQPILNKLIHKIAHDYDFLKNCLKRTIEGDDFTRRLFEIYEFLHKEGFTQDISLGLLRSDYMLDTDETGNVSGLKQVEINTIASSFGGLTSRLHSLHTYLLQQLNVDLSKFPLPNSASQLALGMVHAWEYYGEKKASILFLVEDVTYNFSDQRILEYAILNINPQIKIVRGTFDNMESQGSLRHQKLFLFEEEISVVYFRNGYVPDQYKSEKTWETRKMIEMSKAIKCPSIHYHLAGTKKVQQELFQPNVLERFLEDPLEITKIRAIFAEQFSLDLDTNGDEACQMALAEPEKYVVKPQREGGGNNIYGVEIVNLLKKIGNSKEREGYILMKLIKPPATPNYIVRLKDNITLSNVIGELGIFGVIIGNSTKIFENFEAGHMLRSKVKGTNEGGVAAGYGSLDLPYLL